MTEFLNTTVNNNLQFNTEAMQRAFMKHKRKTQFTSVNPHQSMLFYPAESDDSFKSTNLSATTTDLIHKKLDSPDTTHQ